MTVKVIDSSAGGCLILILPVAFLIIFLFTTWPVLLALLVLSAIWNIWQRYQWQKWSQQVNPIFHRLIQENRGSITALDLAIKANLPATTAKWYLDNKAVEFGAQRQDDKDQGTVYYFITASTLGSIFDDSEILSQPERKDEVDSPLLSAQNQIVQSEDSGSISTESGKNQSPTRDWEKNQSPPNSLPDSLPLPSKSITPNPAEATAEPSQPNHRMLQSIESLLQSELAKRLDVHSSTIYKRRSDSDFPEWSRSRDPEGIAWKYSPYTKQFSPLEAESQ